MSKETTQQELTRALEFRKALTKAHPQNTDLHDLIQQELIRMIYAKNKESLHLAQQNIEFLLHSHLHPQDPIHPELQRLLKELSQQRNPYLDSEPKTVFGYWTKQGWTSVNFLFLVLPFLTGIFFPPLGIIMLTYSIIDTGLASIDLTRSTIDYWQDAPPPEIRILDEQQIKDLEQHFGPIDAFLPQHNPDPDKTFINRLNTASYLTYVLVFAISIIAIASLLFPPIGIPVVALTALSIIAIVGTGLQFGFHYQKQAAHIQYIEAALQHADQLHDTHHPDSTALISNQLNKHPASHATQHHTPAAPTSIPPTHPNPHPVTGKIVSQHTDSDDDDNDDDHRSLVP